MLVDTSVIPTLSLAGIRSGQSTDLARIAAQIGRAARGLGFFTVIDHGIDPALIAEVLAQARAFFALPQAEKDRLSYATSASFRGYARLGEEHLDPAVKPDIKESYDVGIDYPADHPTILAGAPFHEVNRWPDLPGFRAALTAYHAAAIELVVLLHRAIAVDLGIAERFFDPLFSDPVGPLRILRYPPHPGTFDGTAFGAGAHTDYGNLTILWQDDAGGLEVRARDGSWLAVPPQPDALVCNIGDSLMRWTNDVYVSTPHRVVNRARRERFSIAYFGDPNADAQVACIPSLLEPGATPTYPPIEFSDYLRSRFEATYTS